MVYILKKEILRNCLFLLFTYTLVSFGTTFQSRKSNKTVNGTQERTRIVLQEVFGKLKPMDGKLVLSDTQEQDFIQFTYQLENPFSEEYEKEVAFSMEQLERNIRNRAEAFGQTNYKKNVIYNDSLSLAQAVKSFAEVWITINQDYLNPYTVMSKDDVGLLFPLHIKQAAHSWHVFMMNTAIPSQYSVIYLGKDWPLHPPAVKDGRFSVPYLFKNKRESTQVNNIMVQINATKDICDWFAKNVDWGKLNSLIDQ